MSTLKVNTVLSADTPTVNITDGLNVTGVSTVANITATTVNTTNIINSSPLSNRNIAINGAMEVDQRNGGSAVTSSPGGTLNFAADRNHFYNYGTGQLTATLQRVADAPSGTGLYNSNKVTITTPESTGGTPAADDRFSMQHRIEGRNINRLALGTSGAKDFVISFYIKASIAGDYGLALVNSSGSRSYCMLYPATTSWSRVTLKVPGDTSGTYQAGTSSGLEMKFGLYNGSNRAGANQGTAGTGSWQASSAPQGTTGQTQLGGTNGATWQITGLQVEIGSEATPFEHRQFGEEMALCKRYYNKVFDAESQSGEKPISLAVYETNSAVTTIFNFPKMRVIPSLEITNGTNKFMVRSNSVSDHFDTLAFRYGTTQTAEIVASSGVSGTAGYGGFLRSADTDVYVAFSAEL